MPSMSLITNTYTHGLITTTWGQFKCPEAATANYQLNSTKNDSKILNNDKAVAGSRGGPNTLSRKAFLFLFQCLAYIVVSGGKSEDWVRTWCMFENTYFLPFPSNLLF